LGGDILTDAATLGGQFIKPDGSGTAGFDNPASRKNRCLNFKAVHHQHLKNAITNLCAGLAPTIFLADGSKVWAHPTKHHAPLFQRHGAWLRAAGNLLDYCCRKAKKERNLLKVNHLRVSLGGVPNSSVKVLEK
jgi:hypothetical protein